MFYKTLLKQLKHRLEYLEFLVHNENMLLENNEDIQPNPAVISHYLHAIL